MSTFTTSNRGLAAAFMLQGHQPNRALKDDRGKPALEFDKTPALMDVFGAWKDRRITGNLADFNDQMYEVNKKLKEVW